MSIYYSKFTLNTYAATPYFRAFLPAGYPLMLTLQKCRAFRRLPPNLRELAVRARRWALRTAHPAATADHIELWYDAAGYELDPATGRRLTDAEIDADWPPDADLDAMPLADIRRLPGGFLTDPDHWEERPAPPAGRDYVPTAEELRRAVLSRGPDAAAKAYGVPVSALPVLTEEDYAGWTTDTIQTDIADGSRYDGG